MSWIKFTDLNTGETFDSRKPFGNKLNTVRDAGVDEHGNRIAEIVGNADTVYKYPNGKEIWIDDYMKWRRNKK